MKKVYKIVLLILLLIIPFEKSSHAFVDGGVFSVPLALGGAAGGTATIALASGGTLLPIVVVGVGFCYLLYSIRSSGSHLDPSMAYFNNQLQLDPTQQVGLEQTKETVSKDVEFVVGCIATNTSQVNWNDYFGSINEGLRTCRDKKSLKSFIASYFKNGVLNQLHLPESVAHIALPAAIYKEENDDLLSKINHIAYHLNRCDLTYADHKVVPAFKYAKESLQARSAKLKRIYGLLFDAFYDALVGHGCPALFELRDLTDQTAAWRRQKIYHALLDHIDQWLPTITELYALDGDNKQVIQRINQWIHTMNNAFGAVRKGASIKNFLEDLNAVEQVLRRLRNECEVNQPKIEPVCHNPEPDLPTSTCGTSDVLPDLPLAGGACDPNMPIPSGEGGKCIELGIPENETKTSCNDSLLNRHLLPHPSTQETDSKTDVPQGNYAKKNENQKHEKKTQTREKVEDRVKTYEQALKKALEIIGDVDPHAGEPHYGRLGIGKGKIVGRRWEGYKVVIRLDYDKNKGPHINVTDFRKGRNEDVAIPFEGTEETVKSLLRHLNR